ncbi:MAG: hypothetical protein JNK53_06660 [Phycisphaerae bacterium]|nr:hypothetical protein [Phycisphaerae bacterium]
MNRADGAQWLVLAELLAGSSDGRALAEESFKQAALHGQREDQLAAARTRASAVVAAREAREQAEKDVRLKKSGGGGAAGNGGAGGSGGAAAGGAGAGGAGGAAESERVAPIVPWPALTAAEQTDACALTRKGFDHALQVSGIRIEPVASKYFVLGGDVSKAELESLGRDMDAATEWGMTILGLSKDASPFWGKPTLLALTTQESFAVSEAALYGAKVTAGQHAALHTDGPQAFMTAWRGNDAVAFRTAVLQQVAKALLHRTHSATALPEWAEQGFADWVTRGADTRAPIDRERRPIGLKFIREGGQVANVLAATSANGQWPGTNGVALAVAYLTVDFMIAERPPLFSQWVGAIKAGAPWEAATQQVYGVTPAQLGGSVTAWYRTNDGAPRR